VDSVGQTGEKQTRLMAALARGATVTIFAEFIKLAATYGKLASLIDRITR
jgi:hypothetical protein